MCIIKRVLEELNELQQRLRNELLKHIERTVGEFRQNHEPVIITYGDVSERLFGHRKGMHALGRPAGVISEFYMSHGVQPLSGILCNAVTRLPGQGFNEMFNHFHENEPDELCKDGMNYLKKK